MTEAEKFCSLIKERLCGICELSDPEIAALYRHYQLLTQWNRSLNLTAIRGLEDTVVRHYCESLFLGTRLPADSITVLDVGSGGGFPGIPMAVIRRDCQFTLAESRQRKAVFLREATRGWPNVRVFSGRAERAGERFEWVVSRAVRWKAVLDVGRAVGRFVVLLVGEHDANRAIEAGGAQWQELVPLPWGRNRALLIGAVVRKDQ